jgi:phosphoribosyl 1,2-cyclic phosphodiesterase
MSFKVKFWGVRGSIPSGESPEQWEQHIRFLFHLFFKEGYSKKHDIDSFLDGLPPQTLGGFGIDTSCVELQGDRTSILVDGGSGLRRYAQEITPLLKGGEEHHILLTHFHWDHLLGIPFFTPIFRSDQTVHIYAVQDDLEQNIKVKFSKPFFPVSFEMLASKVIFHKLKPREPNQIGEFMVTPYLLDHPDPCWGFRVEKDRLTYAHCVDTEGTRASREELGLDLPLYQNVDLMYFDAQYTLPELVEKANWGHSAAQIGLDIAMREGIRYVVFGHHDPGATIKNLFDLKKQTREYHEWRIQAAQMNRVSHKTVNWRFGYDGLTLDMSRLKRQD